MRLLRLVGLSALAYALGCAPVFAQAAQYFSSSDYSATTIVAVSNLPQQIGREKTTNSPSQDIADGVVEISTGHAESIAGLADEAKGSSAASNGRSAVGHGQTFVLNRFVLVPNPGYTGSTARVSLGYHLTGSMSATCSDANRCSWATGGVFAQILTTGMDADGRAAPRLDYSKTLITIAHDPGSAAVDQTGALDGVARVNQPVIVQLNVAADTGAGSDGDPYNGYTSSGGSANVHLGVCASSPDGVSIYWASDLFSPVQPVEGCAKDVPTPGPDLGAGKVCDGGTAPDGSPAICGIADMHNHQFANLGFGGLVMWGSPFDPQGIAAALPWCDFAALSAVDMFGLPLPPTPQVQGDGSIKLVVPVHGAAGLKDAIGMAMNEGFGHKVGGVPEFDGWPRWNSYDHQGVYVDWLKRAHDGGLRLMVMHAVNNATFCSLSNQLQGYGCNDMDAVDRQLDGAKQLEQYVDSLSGGPGQGWYRIVYTPKEARDAIAKGQLAVVLGIEVDNLFNCSLNSTCTELNVRSNLDKYYQKGVRHFYPVHVYDNAFGGSAMYDAALNFGNKVSTGSWFSAYDCSADGFQFQLNHPTLLGNFIQTVGLGGSVLPPVYTGGGQCNVRTLTPLGESLIKKAMSHKMLIEVDHMSKPTADAALQLAAQYQYPMVGGHTGFVESSLGPKKSEGQKTPEQLASIYQLGGMVGVISEQGKTNEIGTISTNIQHDCGHSSKSWAQAYLYAVRQTGGSAPVGIGTDFNGFAGQPAPRFGDEACDGDRLARQTGGVGYPFTIIGGNGEKMNHSVVGAKTFDYNYDGFAHMGMLPDFVQDLRSMGLTDTDLKPLFRSAEGYIEMWERAESKNLFPPKTAINPVTSANGAGWYRTNVSLNLTASQNSDGWDVRNVTYTVNGVQTSVPQAPGTDSASVPVTVQQEGQTQVAVTATDSAGNTSAPVTLTVTMDKTAPVVTFAGNAATYTADQTVAITCTSTDALSGIASTSCSNINKPAYSYPLGVNTVSATATDNAGNTTTANVTFTVKSTPTAFINVLTQFVSQSNPLAATIIKKYSALITQLVNATATNNPKLKTAVVNLIVTAINADTGTVFTQSQATTLIGLVKAL